MKRIFALLLCLSALPLWARTEDLPSFKMVWETVKNKHWDLAGTGVNWDEIYKIYEPKVIAASNVSEARKLMSQMLGELGQSHFRIMEAEDSEKVDAVRRRYRTEGTPGFKLALVEKRAFIIKVEEGGAAAKAGLEIGTEIVAVDGAPIGPKIAEVLEAFEGEPHGEVYIPDAINGIVSGQPGETVSIDVQQNGAKRSVKITLTQPKGELKDLMNLTGLFFTYEAKVLPNNLGYVHFNIFMPDVAMSFARDMQGVLAKTDGLIIDLRGNPGGMGALAMTLANRLIDEPGKKLGQMMNADGSMNFPIFPQKPQYSKPVAVLIDGGSASTSEIFAAGMQDLGRARIFGTRSAGAALPSLIIDLPNGDRFQFAIADYVSVSGRHLEGVGVEPDVKTPHTLATLAQKKDASLDAATSWILDATRR